MASCGVGLGTETETGTEEVEEGVCPARTSFSERFPTSSGGRAAVISRVALSFPGCADWPLGLGT